MAAKVYDLSAYLEEQPAKIKLGADEFVVNDGFNDLLKLDALSNRKDELSSTEFVKEFLKVALGEAVAEKLMARNYKIKVYLKIMNCIEDVIGGDDKEGVSQE